MMARLTSLLIVCCLISLAVHGEAKKASKAAATQAPTNDADEEGLDLITGQEEPEASDPEDTDDSFLDEVPKKSPKAKSTTTKAPLTGSSKKPKAKGQPKTPKPVVQDSETSAEAGEDADSDQVGPVRDFEKEYSSGLEPLKNKTEFPPSKVGEYYTSYSKQNAVKPKQEMAPAKSLEDFQQYSEESKAQNNAQQPPSDAYTYYSSYSEQQAVNDKKQLPPSEAGNYYFGHQDAPAKKKKELPPSDLLKDFASYSKESPAEEKTDAPVNGDLTGGYYSSYSKSNQVQDKKQLPPSNSYTFYYDHDDSEDAALKNKKELPPSGELDSYYAYSKSNPAQVKKQLPPSALLSSYHQYSSANKPVDKPDAPLSDTDQYWFSYSEGREYKPKPTPKVTYKGSPPSNAHKTYYETYPTYPVYGAADETPVGAKASVDPTVDYSTQDASIGSNAQPSPPQVASSKQSQFGSSISSQSSQSSSDGQVKEVGTKQQVSPSESADPWLSFLSSTSSKHQSQATSTKSSEAPDQWAAIFSVASSKQQSQAGSTKASSVPSESSGSKLLSYQVIGDGSVKSEPVTHKPEAPPSKVGEEWFKYSATKPAQQETEAGPSKSANFYYAYSNAKKPEAVNQAAPSSAGDYYFKHEDTVPPKMEDTTLDQLYESYVTKNLKSTNKGPSYKPKAGSALDQSYEAVTEEEQDRLSKTSNVPYTYRPKKEKPLPPALDSDELSTSGVKKHPKWYTAYAGLKSKSVGAQAAANQDEDDEKVIPTPRKRIVIIRQLKRTGDIDQDENLEKDLLDLIQNLGHQMSHNDGKAHREPQYDDDEEDEEDDFKWFSPRPRRRRGSRRPIFPFY
ncbi:hypothetical protein HDE_00728 [Halotydeus destructor]|nr:hypothetical protein HDE_00728 [Halotydeus destructor]